MQRPYLITGAAGFIGARFVDSSRVPAIPAPRLFAVAIGSLGVVPHAFFLPYVDEKQKYFQLKPLQLYLEIPARAPDSARGITAPW